MTTARILGTLGLVVLVAIAVAAVGSGGAELPSVAAPGTAVVPASERSIPTTTLPEALPPVLRAAPALERLDGWLQTDITSLDDLRGEVVILEFWTFGCSNCRATLPYLQDIYATYRDRGLEIVGVHSPEFDYEKDPEAILEAAGRLGVTWPIALDTSKVNFHSWQEGKTAYWPRTYVIDQNGQIRFDHIGEGAYDDLEATVAVLLDSA